jgi:tRNA-splicing ligase RtcB
MNKNDFKKISDYLWEIPKGYKSGMRVPARFYASEDMLDDILEDRSLEQLVNITTLKGIQKYSLAMPDIHEGYGFPIGGVAAFDFNQGIISPGGIGYDINCGVCLLKSKKSIEEVKGFAGNLARNIFKEIPSGLGRGGQWRFDEKEFDEILRKGVKWAVKNGYTDKDDLEKIESQGCLEIADPSAVSERAKKRGYNQIGTLGSGNHFLEVEYVSKIFDEEEAKKLGISKNQVVIMVHTGSRGFGHQIATDYIKTMLKEAYDKNIELVDRELVYADFNSQLGQEYFKAMSAAGNFAWVNRQMISWGVKKVWKRMFEDELNIVYDVAHNIAKVEEHILENNKKGKVIVHRKGATRAFPNQPVLIPGNMGEGSYLLVGQEKAMLESFGSVCHGAGRRMSRTQAKKQVRGKELKRDLEEKGIFIETRSFSGLAEEAPFAYKNVDDVVEVVHQAGIAKKVAKMSPLVVVKG